MGKSLAYKPKILEKLDEPESDTFYNGMAVFYQDQSKSHGHGRDYGHNHHEDEDGVVNFEGVRQSLEF